MEWKKGAGMRNTGMGFQIGVDSLCGKSATIGVWITEFIFLC